MKHVLSSLAGRVYALTRRRRTRPRPVAARLGVLALESRVVPAVTWAFATSGSAKGTLTVSIDNNSTGGQDVRIGSDSSGYVKVNYSRLNVNTGPVRSSDVRAIIVNGSDLNNSISLDVGTGGFLNLNGKIRVNAKGGNDTIDGSGFDDVLYGGNGNDTIRGRGGNDTIHGDAGNDYLFGGTGKDKLYGGDGNDDLYWISGEDVVDGGKGNNTFRWDRTSR